MLAPAGCKCNPMSILVCHGGSYRVGVRNPCKVRRIQSFYRKRPAINEDPVLLNFHGLAREPDNALEEPNFQPGMITEMKQHQVSALRYTDPKKLNVGIWEFQAVGGAVHDEFVANQR